ncbi:Long-chain fatty acid transport protein 1-like protein [Leptotrombidium deliense]|uniref:Very long-chain fatty acid transport protein n=1 Tax=Leptotrombidium deliense TaxID=299467 RepID=A0A443SU19_9ACAR|nr:Long-chain fatty acid transport protein 1-like protein [Leptotrombidium deliense]
MEQKSLICRFVKFIAIFWKIMKRDLRGAYCLLMMKYYILKLKLTNSTVDKLFAKVLPKNKDKIAFICEEKSWTFKEVDEYTNQIANYFTSQGFKAGDEVALLMPSKTEHGLIWFGLSKIGVVTALINDNLRLEPLVHCITCVKSKAVIFDAQLSDAISESHAQLKQKTSDLKYYSYGPIENNAVNAENLKEKISEQRFDCVITKHSGNFTDLLCYIYTSGTTGLPKAALIKQYRMALIPILRNVVLNVTEDDIIYNAMPLYHTIGAALGVTTALVTGHTVVIRGKFSASKFWDDCIRYNCTTVGYIGEVCRYLMAQPPKITDKMHKVNKMYGVGLRESLWKDFVDRFGVKNIMEFFGSTEGNSNLVNIDGKEGACGFLPTWVPTWLSKRIFPVKFIKVDPESGEVMRNEKNLCTSLGVEETGMLVAKIDNSNPISAFDGYVDKTGTEKKIIRNVFEKGDAYFISGDLVYMDEFGYIYFRDRIGDTFRWKGENVSTNEVEGIISKLLDIPNCVVYGVEIPKCDGRAGMVTVCTSEAIDFENFFVSLEKTLPKYAIPLFVRIKDKIELTGTFKFSKVTLKKEAFNIEITSDPIYVIDYKNKTYKQVNENIYDDILNSKIRF